MFLKINPSQSGSDRYGSQRAGGPFLMLFSIGRELRACVRSVQLEQCGHFMMGSTTIHGTKITLSGSYGADGLPIDPGRYDGIVWERLLQVPPELAERYWKSDWHNDAGSEGPTIRKWALENFNALRKAAVRPVLPRLEARA